MKASALLTALALTPTPLLAAAAAAVAAPASEPIAAGLALAPAPAHHVVSTVVEPRVDARNDAHSQHWKRKGGGGGRGGGSNGGGSKSGGSKSSSKSKTSSSSKKSKPSRTTSSSNAGGRTSAGTGPPRSFGNGKYYAGGSSTPFTSGSRSPLANIGPALIGGAAAGLVFGALLTSHGASSSSSPASDSWYFYHWPEPYHFFNASTNRNESDEVVCGCRSYAVCGCDYTNDTSYMAGIVGDGRYASLNKSLVSVADYEGNRTIFIDGTLPNGTTAPGGTDDAGVMLAPLGGYWPVVMLAGAMAWVL